MSDTRNSLVDILRGRVLRGLHAGVLEPGARLPSARELVDEFDVDHRIILAAYRELATEGLVEVRERGGVYVAPADGRDAVEPTLPVSWIVDTLTGAFAREVCAPDVSELMRRAVETLRLRAVVVSSTEDQVVGLARELREDFGLTAEGVVVDRVRDRSDLPSAVRQADLLVVTHGHAEMVEALGADLGKPVIAIDVRPDLVAGEWALLLRQPVWAVVGSAAFGDMLRHFFRDVRGIENLTILVHGRDDLSTIPAGAPTYVTGRVREALNESEIPGRILPTARTIATDSAAKLFAFIVNANLRAAQALASASAAGSTRERGRTR